MSVDIYQPLAYVPRGVGAAPSRLSPLGPYFVDPAGQIVIRKSITAFTLSKRYAQGRAAEANAFLDCVASMGLNEVRVFCRTEWGQGKGGVEDGWEYNESACEQALVEAGRRGLRVELVAHTAPMNADAAAALLANVDALCLRHNNALLEVWNEPQQNGGEDLLRAVLARYTPRTPGWASGWYTTDPGPRGQSLNYHSPRKVEAPRCFKDAFEWGTGQGPNQSFAPGFTGPIHLDEPPQIEQREYMHDEADWEAYGAGAAFFAAGATGHDNPVFQRCEVPTDAYLIGCVRAFVRGFAAVPVQRYHGYNHEDDQGALRRYARWGDDGKKYVISVRPFSFGAV